MNVNIGKINRIFGKAEEEGRDFLLETEVYELLRSSGIVPPRYIYLEAGRRINRKDLSLIPSRSVVVKIVSPLILHKSDVGGVEVVGNRSASVNVACERMLGTVPSRFRLWKKKSEFSIPGEVTRIVFPSLPAAPERAWIRVGEGVQLRAAGADRREKSPRICGGRDGRRAPATLLRYSARPGPEDAC